MLDSGSDTSLQISMVSEMEDDSRVESNFHPSKHNLRTFLVESKRFIQKIREDIQSERKISIR